MRMHGREKPGEVATLTKLQQEAAALDYTANIAAGQRVLADKWNVTNQDGLIVNNGDPKYIENWFFALWAYNSGYYPKAAAAQNGGLWGVGFTNNPANPLWKANRTPFLEGPAGADDYSQASHPQDWPYPEKVIGWAARPLEGLESPGKMVSGFRPAWWTNNALRSTAKPAENLFCTSANNCDPSKIGPNDKNEPGLGACKRDDLKCWWNQPVKWKDCTKAECGNEIMRFNDTYTEEADGTAYPPNCSTQGLPANAIVVDDVPNGTPIHRPGCQPPVNSGTFNLEFGTPSAKIDLHQIGAGYNSHFWFAHARQAGAEADRMKVTGTWKVTNPKQGQHEVFVHLPDHGAQAPNVQYDIQTEWGVRSRVINQKGTTNRWVSIGYYDFSDRMEVKLSTTAAGGTGDLDVAFDAVAFAPSNYSFVPEINIPQPNPSAPDPDIYAQEPENYNLTAPFLRSGAEKKCTTKDKNGKYSCISLTPSTLQAPPANKGSAKSSLAGAGIPLSRCHSIPTEVSRTRFDGCLKRDVVVQVYADNGGTPGVPPVLVGTAFFHMVQEITIPSNDPKSTGFANWFGDKVYLQLFGMQGELTTITANPLETQCNSAVCTITPGIAWQGGATWAGPLDGHWASFYNSVRWTNTAQGATDRFDLNEVVTFTIPAATLRSAGTWSTTPMGSITCDRVITTVGCVMSGYVPTWVADDQKYPAAAAYYWVLREKLASHPGSKSNKTPLHRESDRDVIEESRARVCDRGVKANLEPWTAHPKADGDADGIQCDEFPFASTEESGGRTLLNGKSCVQLYAKMVGGSWHLFSDGRYDPLPSSGTWPQICGRASMPGTQNMDAGRVGVSPFYLAMRIKGGDPFFFKSPRYEGCKVSTVCTV